MTGGGLVPVVPGLKLGLELEREGGFECAFRPGDMG